MKDSVCWQLVTDDQPTPSTILGTVHLSIDDVMQRWQSIQTIIDTYDKIYTESSLATTDQQYQQQFIVLEDPSIYLQYVTPRRWAKMRATFLHYYKVDLYQVAHLRPLFILTAIHQSILGQVGGASLDQEIWDYAVANEKVVAGIETAQEQIDILLALPEETQYRQLVKLSRNISGQQRKIKQLIQAYIDQDVDKMYRLSARSMRSSRSLLLHDRNDRMVRRILDWHRKEASFFSFGAGHLGGRSGVLRQLRKSGATITPVIL